MQVLFGSYYNYLDPTSGAAISTRATLKALARQGRKVEVFNGALFDRAGYNDNSLERIYRLVRAPITLVNLRTAVDGKDIRYRLARFDDDGIEATADNQYVLHSANNY